MALYGGVEAGGTKFVCAVGDGLGSIRAFIRFPTTTPDETLRRVVSFFQQQPEPIVALGVGAFGPVDLDPASSTYGYVTTTPKPGWSHTDVRTPLAEALGVPVHLLLDVAAAALGECQSGAAIDVSTFLYLTVGTGIGGALMQHGHIYHALSHPELGHIPVPRAPGDTFEGVCPYHGACLEGLVSGPALRARYGNAAEDLPDEHEAWGLVAHYLGAALTTYVLSLAPHRIVIGGGVSQQDHLFPRVRAALLKGLGGYLDLPPLRQEGLAQYVVPAALGPRSGVLGAMAHARTHWLRRDTQGTGA